MKDENDTEPGRWHPDNEEVVKNIEWIYDIKRNRQ